MIRWVVLWCMAAGAAIAHGTEVHAPKAAQTQKAANPVAQLPTAVTPLPWDVGGPFQLTDHTGQTRTQKDPDGKMQLLFFGYANCPGICSAALPLMAEMTDGLADQGIEAVPVMITIDPKLDTVDNLGPALGQVSGRFVGLTGEKADLQVAYDAFRVTFEYLFEDPDHGPIYSHGSHIYLLDGAGEVLTLLPPVLPTEQAVAIVARYAKDT